MDGDFARHAVDLGKELGREDVGGRARGGDLAVAQYVETVAVVRGQVEVVQGHQDRRGQSSQGTEDVQLVPDVEVVGRFVQDQQGRLLGQGTGDEHALAFAAGELIEGTVGQVGGVHRGERRPYEAGVFGGVPVQQPLMRGAAHRDDLTHREFELRARLLYHRCHRPGELPYG